MIALATVAVLVAALVVWSPWSNNGHAPSGLDVGSRTATSVSLRWTAPASGPSVDRFLILRDGRQVGSVPAGVTSFLDRGLAPATTYRYTVVAVSGQTRSAPSAELSVRTLAPSPTGLRVSRHTTDGVRLTWARPANGAAPDHYVVSRDGREVATVRGTVTSFRDTGLAPATAFRYRVVAMWGDVASAPAAVTVRTLTPPVSAARLEGSWPVHIKVIGSEGGSLTVGRTMTDRWTFHPVCRAGACSVVVSGVVGASGYIPHHFRATLTRAGGVYSGSTKAHITHCGNPPVQTSVQNTVTVKITIQRAAALKEAWAARSWIGTMTLASPYSTAGIWYCPAQTVTASLSATR